MATKPTFITLVTILSLFSLSSALHSQSILNAAETLSNSGYIAMALTLQLISDDATKTAKSSSPPSFTIFAPADSAFAASGQPSLSLLQLHLSPVSLSPQSLNSLPYGTRIPTLSSSKSLTITTLPSSSVISLNNVTITGSPIFDDGSVIVYGIENFFDPNFTISAQIETPGNQNLGCETSRSYRRSEFLFHDASLELRSRGYSIMASLLELQLVGFLSDNHLKLTVFAPFDELMFGFSGDFSDYSSLFFRHVVPCKVTWADLVNIGSGTVLETYLEGFGINVTRSGDLLMVNGVSVGFPDMHYSDLLVVHGIGEVLALPVSVSDEIGSSEESMAPDRSEF
ncbi:unnamed protein product [Ilex paraguariensis]|uniref:FAS1 domain-containing protein n=1 Tax=Ilex paraguariensis TaxID=185542 RepID=A0ABC8RNY8_9AQUA